MQCEKCKSKWETDTGVLIEICPFCQAKLTVVDNRTPEQKMRFIGNKFSTDLYDAPIDFCAVIDDNFNDENDATGRLLKFLINHNASNLVLTLKDLPLEDLNQEFNKIIEELEYNMFIPQNVLTPAITLLCIGLGIENFQLSFSDFKIEDKVLVEYIGDGGSVTIPNLVTSIGEDAFLNCTYLNQVTIPNSVTSIDDYAFKGCDKLPEDVVDQIYEINPRAFG